MTDIELVTPFRSSKEKWSKYFLLTKSHSKGLDPICEEVILRSQCIKTLPTSLSLLHVSSWPNMPTDMRSNTVVSPDIPTKETSKLTGMMTCHTCEKKICNTQHRLSLLMITIPKYDTVPQYDVDTDNYNAKKRWVMCQLCRTVVGGKLRLLLGDRPGSVLKGHPTISNLPGLVFKTNPSTVSSVIPTVTGEETGKRSCPSQSPTPRIKDPKVYTTYPTPKDELDG